MHPSIYLTICAQSSGRDGYKPKSLKHNYPIVVVMITMKTDCNFQQELMAIYFIKGDFINKVMFNSDIKCASTDYIKVGCVCGILICVCSCVLVCLCICVWGGKERHKDGEREE